MKNTIAVLALSSLFAVSACNKPDKNIQNIDKVETAQPEKFVVDSVKIEDSTKIADSLSAQFDSKLLVFPTIKDKKLLDSIYFNIKGNTDYSKQGLQKFLEKDKADYFKSVKNDSKDFISDIRFSLEWYESSGMTMVSNKNDYMHIEYSWGSYSGGAHDNFGFSERVFDLKNNKKVELKDITSMSKKQLETLLKKNINKMNGGATDENGEINNSDMLLEDIIPPTANFYFDDKNLYFHYSPYEITAFAAGDITIPISFEELKATLTPEFKKRMNIK
ncbi:RsiV family protein [Chryseobacterium sp. MMS23-Vi53]|uniref:RsiV family protein n=1 Tax=Chryseobacterium sp. MMS23-Vi53 TaxID=3386644 RepID=UPI0039E7B067